MNNLLRFVAFHGDQTVKIDVVLDTEKIVHMGEIVRDDDVEKWEIDLDAPLRTDYLEISKETGIPVWFVMLSSTLAAHMAEADAGKFMVALVNAIPAGVDVSLVWPKFVQELLRAGNNALGACIAGDKQTSALIHVKTLHKMSNPDLESFARKARETFELASQCNDPAQGYALEAASAMCWASYYGGYGGTVAETKSARLAVNACHCAVQAMILLEGPVFDYCSAYAFIGQTLVECVESTFSQSQQN